MVRFTSGDLLASDAEALVNAVNTVGVMGKGLALAFKVAYPANFRAYAAACRTGEVRTGRVFVTEPPGPGPRWIVNFPTKQNWRDPSRLEWIAEGLDDLRAAIIERGMRSVAVPALGCGLGGLGWDVVRPLIERALSPLDGVNVRVFAPGS